MIRNCHPTAHDPAAVEIVARRLCAEATDHLREIRGLFHIYPGDPTDDHWRDYITKATDILDALAPVRAQWEADAAEKAVRRAARNVTNLGRCLDALADEMAQRADVMAESVWTERTA